MDNIFGAEAPHDPFQLNQGTRTTASTSPIDPLQPSPEPHRQRLDSVAEMQRVVGENRKLRQENTALKIQVQSLSASAPRLRSDGGAVEAEVENESEAGSERRRRSGPSTPAGPSAAHKKAMEKLQEELATLRATHQRQSEMFSSFTLDTAEREASYALVYEGLREQLDAAQKERDQLRKALEEQQQQAETAKTLVVPSAAPSSTQEAVGRVLQSVQAELHSAMQRVARSAARSLGSNPDTILAQLAPAPVSATRRLRSSTKGTGAAEDSGRVEHHQVVEEAESFFSEDIAALPAGAAPHLSLAFRRELEQRRAFVEAKGGLRLPPGAGALRASHVSAAGGPNVNRKRARPKSVCSTTSAARGRPVKEALEAKQERENASDTSSVREGANPFQSTVSMVGRREGEAEGSSQRSHQLLPSAAASASSSVAALRGMTNPLEALFDRMNSSTLLQYRKELRLLYAPATARSSGTALMASKVAEDAQNALTKRCTAMYAVPSHLAESPSPFAASWVSDWSSFAAVEDEVWRFLERVLRLEVDGLAAVLQATLTRAVLAVVSDSAEGDTPDETSAPVAGSDVRRNLVLHTLATALNFLALQNLLPRYKNAESDDAPHGSKLSPARPSPASLAYAAALQTTRQQMLQLLYDSSVALLQQWLQVGERESRVEDTAGVPSSPVSRVDTPRAAVGRLWMTLLRGLVGRTVERLHLLDYSGCPRELYDHIFTQDLLVIQSPYASPCSRHGMIVYTIKAVLWHCLTQAAGHEPVEALENSHLVPLRAAWESFTECVGWSSAGISLEHFTKAALQVALTEPKHENDRSAAEKSTTVTVARREGDTSSVRSPAETEASDSEASDGSEDSEDETVALTPGEQATALLAWEANSGPALLALRLVVLINGFNFINAVLQPFVQGKPRAEDIMAYILSAAVIDMKWVGEPALEPAVTGSPTSPASPQSTEATEVQQRVLHYLMEYITSPPAAPFERIGTIRVTSAAALLQLLGTSSPNAIRKHLMPLATWLRTAVRKFAMKEGVAVSEDVRIQLPRLLPKDCAWNSKMGQWVLEALL